MPRCARAREEVGLDLGKVAYLGQLDDRRIRYAGDGPSPVLSSFVFFAGRTPPELRPDGWETEAAYWISLAHLRRDANRTIVPWDTRRMPGIRYLDQVIWGPHPVGVPVPSSRSSGPGSDRTREPLPRFPFPDRPLPPDSRRGQPRYLHRFAEASGTEMPW